VKHLTEHEAWRRYVRIRFMDFGWGLGGLESPAQAL
jgi:hypothetical protein